MTRILFGMAGGLAVVLALTPARLFAGSGQRVVVKANFRGPLTTPLKPHIDVGGVYLFPPNQECGHLIKRALKENREVPVPDDLSEAERCRGMMRQALGFQRNPQGRTRPLEPGWSINDVLLVPPNLECERLIEQALRQRHELPLPASQKDADYCRKVMEKALRAQADEPPVKSQRAILVIVPEPPPTDVVIDGETVHLPDPECARWLLQAAHQRRVTPPPMGYGGTERCWPIIERAVAAANETVSKAPISPASASGETGSDVHNSPFADSAPIAKQQP